MIISDLKGNTEDIKSLVIPLFHKRGFWSEFEPKTIEHLECEYFGELENEENLEIRDTPIPKPNHLEYVRVDDYKCYQVMAFEIDLDKLQ